MLRNFVLFNRFIQATEKGQVPGPVIMIVRQIRIEFIRSVKGVFRQIPVFSEIGMIMSKGSPSQGNGAIQLNSSLSGRKRL